MFDTSRLDMDGVQRMRTRGQGAKKSTGVAKSTTIPPFAPSRWRREIAVPVMAWFVVSAFGSTWFNSTFLLTFEGHAGALTLIRFVGSAALGAMYAPRRCVTDFVTLAPAFIPAATCLLGANLFNSFALADSGVTLTYVTKAAIPLCTLVILLVRRRPDAPTPPPLVWTTLIPICLGVGLSAMADAEVTARGFAFAAASTAAQSLLNVLSRETIRISGLDGSRSQFILVAIASAVLSTATTAYIVVFNTSLEAYSWRATLTRATTDLGSMFVLVLTAVTYHTEYVLNFVVVDIVDPVAFAVLDVLRRMSIIVVGSVLFHKPLTPLNAFGVVLALSGTFLYSLASTLSKRKSDKGKESYNTRAQAR